MNGEIAWLEPKKDPISGSYLVFSANDSDMELLTYCYTDYRNSSDCSYLTVYCPI